MAKTEFQTFLEQEVNKVKGVYYPVKAGFLRRLLIKEYPEWSPSGKDQKQNKARDRRRENHRQRKYAVDDGFRLIR